MVWIHRENSTKNLICHGEHSQLLKKNILIKLQLIPSTLDWPMIWKRHFYNAKNLHYFQHNYCNNYESLFISANVSLLWYNLKCLKLGRIPSVFPWDLLKVCTALSEWQTPCEPPTTQSLQWHHHIFPWWVMKQVNPSISCLHSVFFPNGNSCAWSLWGFPQNNWHVCFDFFNIYIYILCLETLVLVGLKLTFQ